MRRVLLIIAAAVLVAATTAIAVTRGPSPSTAGAGSTPNPAANSAPGAASRTGAAPDTGAAASSATAPAAAAASTRPPSVRLSRIPGSYDQPVYVTAPRGDTARLFIVEKTGTIRILKNGAVLSRPFLDISGQVSRGGEQGLLSMAFDPRYASNGRFYVNFTNTSGDTRVVRYRVSRVDRNRAATSTARVLLRIDQPYSNHNGGQLQFGPDGRLYVGTGDGGSGGDPQGRAQNPRSRLGKLLRLNVGVSPVRVGIYAKGLRNPWRFSFDRRTGALWIGDVGQGAREEIDYLRPGRKAGANFGWNGYEGTLTYNSAVASRLPRSSLTWPVSQYGRDLGYSVTGGYVYRGSAIPALRGFYLFADFGSGHVWAKRGPGANRYTVPGANNQVTQISSFGQDAAGELYIVSLAGQVYKIVSP
jgi:glucose/arabinose dehydrogenase